MSSAAGAVLGLDLGANSLGSALISTDEKKVIFTGVRIFPAGMEGDLDTGREESRAKKRRDARSARRQTDRRRRRLNKLFRLLQKAGLLAAGKRSEVVPALQRLLEKRYPDTQIVPYYLRARALDEKLEPEEIGRALYHLAQRRGFLSNRISSAKESDEDRGKVKDGIRTLQEEIASACKRTLGEYLASLNPEEKRIRVRYTHRNMYHAEFEAIWEAQKQHYPELLTPDRKKDLQHAIFFQRPLKDVSKLVGQCELQPAEKRAPLYCLDAQRLRVLGFVNNLKVELADMTDRDLGESERATLLDLCDKAGKVKFPDVRKALGLGKQKFTIERGGEKNVPGNISAARCREVLGLAWDELPAASKEQLVDDLGDARRFPDEEAMARHLMARWGLEEKTAKALAAITLPDGYAPFSRVALRRLLPHLKNVRSVEEAIREEYPESRQVREPLALLPPVKKVQEILGEIRNPAVLRALTELRKTVNAIVRRYGKPAEIHIELARDLKRTRKERMRDAERNREREKLRDIAREELRSRASAQFAEPRRSDIEKCLLAIEAKWRCPYTDRGYGLVDVFGEHPQVDVEHIIPRSRSLDDSFSNKVLAYREANVEKGNKTPVEWLKQSDPERYDRMIDLVKRFDSRFEVKAKLRRFAMDLTSDDQLLQEFTERQLQETRYATKLAAKYLGLLYGAVVDRDGTKRVIACAGGVTAKLRRAWDLEAILRGAFPERKKQPGGKYRGDQRHHAVDAVAVALTSQGIIQKLAEASAESDRLRRWRVTLAAPWPAFADQVRTAIEATNVSLRPTRMLGGPLHEDTFYSRPRPMPGKNGKVCVHYRVLLEKLDTEEHVASIVDPKVREAVHKKFLERGAKKGWYSEGDPPLLVTRKGASIPIRKVRIRKVKAVKEIGKGDSRRNVITGDNHHMAVLAELDIRGSVKRFRHETISRFVAAERQRQDVPVIQKEYGAGRRLVCTLSEGDLLEAARTSEHGRRVWRIRAVRTSGQLDLCLANDGRLNDDQKADKSVSGLWKPTIGPLFNNGARKVLVTHTGEIIPAND